MGKLAFLFAPGAGAGSSHPWMQHWACLLERLGSVKTFDYPYMLEGRMPPDRLPKLIAAHLAALKALKRTPKTKVVLVGKSMGSRIGCHVSLEARVDAVVCLGYPLCGGGNRANLRDKVLVAMHTPVLFVQGTRDPLCPLDLLAKVRRRMKAPTKIIKVMDGDHSLTVAKRQLKASRTTQVTVEENLILSIAKFINSGRQ